MKSCIFCTCFINGRHPTNNPERYKRWIDFYTSKMEALGAEYLFLIDDGSPEASLIGKDIAILDQENLPIILDNKINLVRFKNNLGRPAQRDYRGWWRSFSYSYILANTYGFEKIIHIESDFFLVSQKIVKYIKEISGGWTAFYSPFFLFPESGIQIIVKDAYNELYKVYEDIRNKNYEMNKSAEFYLPFTNIEKKYFGDRFGELDVFAKHVNLHEEVTKVDWIGQVLPHFKTDDFEPFFEFEYKWE